MSASRLFVRADLATGVEAPSSGRDNLGTLRLVHALYRSVDFGEAQVV